MLFVLDAANIKASPKHKILMMMVATATAFSSARFWIRSAGAYAWRGLEGAVDGAPKPGPKPKSMHPLPYPIPVPTPLPLPM